MSAAQYRILTPAGEQREDGGADVEVAGGALVLAPSAGGVLRIPFGQIASVTEPEPFTVRITLADGNVIDLSRLGVMHTQPAAARPWPTVTAHPESRCCGCAGPASAGRSAWRRTDRGRG